MYVLLHVVAVSTPAQFFADCDTVATVKLTYALCCIGGNIAEWASSSSNFKFSLQILFASFFVIDVSFRHYIDGDIRNRA